MILYLYASIGIIKSALILLIDCADMKIVDYFGFEQETLADKTTEILNVKHQRI
jgi:hypothetical protein